MRRVLLHVGSNKTGTTLLQTRVLPRVSGVTLVGTRAQPTRHPVDERLIPALRTLTNEADFVTGSVARPLSEVETDRPVMISEEGLASSLRHAGFDHLCRTFDRLHGEIPEASVLLVVRRQDDHIRSNHRQYVALGGSAPLEDFVSGAAVPGPRRLSAAPHSFDRRMHDFALVYEELARRWPAPPRVVPYEMLHDDPRGFLSTLLAGVDVDGGEMDHLTARAGARLNESESSVSVWLIRVANRLAWAGGRGPRVAKALGHRMDRGLGLRGSGLDRRLRGRDRALLEDLLASYGPSNRRLAEVTGLDLGRYGYW